MLNRLKGKVSDRLSFLLCLFACLVCMTSFAPSMDISSAEIDTDTSPEVIKRSSSSSVVSLSTKKSSITKAKKEYKSVGVPNNDSDCKSYFKAYMSYNAVTDTSSKQYKLLHSAKAHTDTSTGLRMIGDRYCVAIGSGYGIKVDDKLDLNLSSGNTIKCIMSDQKSDWHTDSSNKYCKTNGSVAEFLVDYSVFNDVKDSSGTVNFVKGFRGDIVSITKVSD